MEEEGLNEKYPAEEEHIKGFQKHLTHNMSGTNCQQEVTYEQLHFGDV